MKKVKFNKIYIEGFGSIIKPLEFNFNKKGVTIISGKNGAGKSSVFNALFWVLYGTLLKDVNTTSIPTKKAYRNKDFKGTRVLVEVSVDKVSYQIARHIRFKGKTFEVTGNSTVIITKKGKRLDIGSEDKKDWNNYIVDLIGLDKDGFLNAILFGQKMKRLLDSKDAARREVFESMIDLSFIDEALENCKSDLTHSQSLLDKYQVELQTKNEVLDSLKSSYKELKQEVKEIKKDRRKNYNSIKQEIEKYEAKIKCSTSEEKEISKLKKQLDKNRKVLDKFRSDAKEAERIHNANQGELKVEKYNYQLLHKELLDSGSKTCSKCGSKLNPAGINAVKRDVENRIKASNKKIRKLENDNRLYYLNVDKSNEEFTAFNIKNEEIRTNYHERNKKHTNKDAYKDMIQDLQERLESITKEKEEKYITRLAKLKSKCKEAEEDIVSIESYIKEAEEKVELLLWWVKKGFSNTGLKQFMFSSFLSKLNVATAKYTAPLGFFIDFGIDTSKATKPFTTKCYFEDGVEFNYNEYSGGESVRVSIATMLGINDVVCKDVDINIMLFDEVFESLDELGKEQVFELLTLKNKKSIFVITHINEVDLINANKIEVIKENHNTILV